MEEGEVSNRGRRVVAGLRKFARERRAFSFARTSIIVLLEEIVVRRDKTFSLRTTRTFERKNNQLICTASQRRVIKGI